MNPADVGRLALIVMTPTLIGAVVVFAPRWCSWISGMWEDRRAAEPQPVGPPIEQLAADLRRLLRLHAELNASAHAAMRAHRVWAVEAAIAVRAVEAARALGVPYQEPSGPAGTAGPGGPAGSAGSAGPRRGELSALLRALAAAGLVLPEKVGPFVGNGRF